MSHLLVRYGAFASAFSRVIARRCRDLSCLLLQHAPIILLKEGADTSQGRGQIISNINACQVVVDIVRSTLGPRGMDKLIETESGATITNDGATVLNLLQVKHPAAALLVDVAQSQDLEVGDGTTSVVVLAGELLQEAKAFVEDGMATQVIIKGLRAGRDLALQRIDEVQLSLADKAPESRRALLLRCAETSLNSKLLSAHKTFFAEASLAWMLLHASAAYRMVVEAVTLLGPSLDISMVGLKKEAGGSYGDSRVVRGVAFKKTFSYAGFEQQPKKLINPKILLLNLELELKAEKENAEVRLDNPDHGYLSQQAAPCIALRVCPCALHFFAFLCFASLMPQDYQSIVDAEWDLIYEKLQTIADSGATVVFSKLPIGDLATQFFADRNIFCAGRVEDADLQRAAKATGAKVQSTVSGLTPDVLGSCGLFEEAQVGSERYNILSECPEAESATILLRGGAPQFLDEAERSLHDAIMIVRRALRSHAVVGGGGAIEMELSRYIREHSKTVAGKQQLVLKSFARALEAIPRALTRNAGFDATDVLNQLRQKHATSSEVCWIGVDCINGGVADSMAAHVWEPAIVKQHALAAATEAACLILSIDETITQPNPQDKKGGIQ
ncbi:t-complex protein 1 ETA subunit [Cyclospora cayetanensis]|uniref:T-complex protein 1 subunit eta n=1 Tax=Cyclospora cayetanensis TaxID=88456 RepID=A0A1D3D950_9EIME|nr:t-complex protein 1 ETA subunit [Cyclospora cayetanensis]